MPHRLIITWIAIIALAGVVIPHVTSAQTDERCFPETNQCIRGPIRAYWERNGGLPVFGYPTSTQSAETVEGRYLQVQWFERDRLEIQVDGLVTAGRLGAQRLEQLGTPWQFRSGGRADPGCRLFPETGYQMCGAIADYWNRYGGLERFGFPLTDPFQTELEGRMYTVQYFERRRFELHPEIGPNAVLLGLLGNEVLAFRNGGSQPTPVPTTPPYPNPAPSSAPTATPTPTSIPSATPTSIPTATPSPTPASTPLALPDTWLERVNAYRALAGVAAVNADTTLNDNCYQHARYMAENNDLTHNQNAQLPWASPAGQICAEKGNAWLGSGTGWQPRDAVDGWMSSVGHRLWLLYPTTPTFGFGFYTTANGQRSAAGLDVLSYANFNADSGFTQWPIRYPASGQISIPASQYAITLLWPYFKDTPQIRSTSLSTQDGTPVLHSASNNLPAGHKGILIKPNANLADNTIYRVQVEGTYAGQTFSYSWLFSTGDTALP
ncbi:CAP domain-containing protein [Candidatus Oscillochloris fontis]|uniref:CAP domain-containing protein n=1 Tax=Candidatus Oscillochloris fontis TaxID=2496868 RepID=UPI001EE80A24|nr:CAP domain-containing protein [Candidatus Oscillochloris fontis]